MSVVPWSQGGDRAGGRGDGVQGPVPASHAPRSPSLIALITWNGAKQDGNGDLHASPGNGVSLHVSVGSTVVRRGTHKLTQNHTYITYVDTHRLHALWAWSCACLVDACRFQVSVRTTKG